VELPDELAGLEENLRRPEPYTPFPLSRKQGFVRAVVDPLVHALHTSLLLRYKKKAPARENALEELVEKAGVNGPGSLPRREKRELLKDPRQLGELHRRGWEAESRDGAAQWGLVLPPSESGE
jgi:membrane glycosyltransferase